MSATSPARTGAVYDRGYRPYEGELGGRRAARAALFRASVRRAVGLRRSWKQKLFPWLLLAIATVPAVVWVGVAYITRGTPAEAIEIISYREYVGVSTALLVFVGFAAPDVICPDRRNRTLPLLFSRPLTGTDYVVAKVGAIFAVVFAFSFLPQVVLYVGQLLVSDSALDYLGDNLDVLWKVPLATVAFALYFAVLACAISSLTTRRLIAAASLLILLLGTAALSSGLSESTGAPVSTEGVPLDDILPEEGDVTPIRPHELEDLGLEDEVQDGPIVVGGTETDWYVITQPSSAWGALDLLSTPMFVRDLVFEGEILEPYLEGVDGAGAMAVGVYLLVVTGSACLLWWRYRWLEP